MASSWYSLISPCVILLYANHRLKNIMSGPNLAETKHVKIYCIEILLVRLLLDRISALDLSADET